MMVFRLAISALRVAVLSLKISSNSASGSWRARDEILDRELQREERILELVRQTPRQLAPRGHALALDEPLALARELLRHVIKAARQHAHLVAAAFRHAHVPVAGGNLFRRARQLFDGPRDARGDPQAEGDGKQNAAGRDAVGNGANVLLRLDHAAARDRDDQHCHHVAGRVLERNCGRVQAVFALACQIDDSAGLLPALARSINQVLVMNRPGQVTVWSQQPRRIESGQGTEHSFRCAQIHRRR